MTKSLSLVCSYCHHLNHGILFRPSLEVSTFTCETCGNENYIVNPVDESVRQSAEPPKLGDV